MDFVTDLVTFSFDLVTFFSPNRDDKLLCLVVIRKRDIGIFVENALLKLHPRHLASLYLWFFSKME